MQYLIHWEGYGDKHDQWIVESGLPHAKDAIKEAQKNMKKQFNKKRRNSQGLKVGDNVWLENKNIYLN